jgi:hypothetical protein
VWPTELEVTSSTVLPDQLQTMHDMTCGSQVMNRYVADRKKKDKKEMEKNYPIIFLIIKLCFANQN